MYNHAHPALLWSPGLVCFMSETGVVKVDEKDVVRKGRLGPGNMITIDLETGVFRVSTATKHPLSIAKHARLPNANTRLNPKPWSSTSMSSSTSLCIYIYMYIYIYISIEREIGGGEVHPWPRSGCGRWEPK